MKKMMAVLILCIVSAGASAQGMPMAGGGDKSVRAEQVLTQLQERFAAANTTRDGKLTQAQAQAGMPMVARHFDEIDAQRVGYITLPQIEVFMAQHMKQR
ncbi:EF-hand domain-containing protein [Cupriavidus sp. SW-Y-13]|uniref:EF-hand domain-containing protein n=1 Tax=Cupriavidus sp. SW-Y-13 TaxID=2653854 RepID=UPI0013655A9F|nr:EF-hand domain-containing protein [Cupriavidus sp. SW-Y-13]MWL90364.1 EF-hand domain-containing protein [Cupriavidus sp. SW-Y-13]